MINDTADRIALQDVMLKYAAGIDDRDFDLYRTCFTDDVEVIGMGKETVIGIEAWMQFVMKALSRYDATQHMLGPQLATIEGDKASTRTDLQALHNLKEQPGKTFILWATYRSDMIRIDGEWKIKRHELITRGSRTQ